MIRELLRQHQDAIVQRWYRAALDTYPAYAAAAFEREVDPFANPVGHNLRVTTEQLFHDLLEGKSETAFKTHLRELMQIRAVQNFSPSQAISVVFLLKDAIQDELGDRLDQPQLALEWKAVAREIDRIALTGFDVFMECREQIHQLRINEVKRRVSWIAERLNGPTVTESPETQSGRVT